MVFQQAGAIAAEHTITVLGEMPHVAIELLIPVREGSQVRQVLDLVEVTRAQAASINFLQGHQIKIAKQIANALQIAIAAGMRQQVFQLRVR